MRNVDLGGLTKRRVNGAMPLCQTEERGELRCTGVSVQIEVQSSSAFVDLIGAPPKFPPAATERACSPATRTVNQTAGATAPDTSASGRDCVARQPRYPPPPMKPL